jgi:uncharacterized Zn finger protein
MSPKKSAKSIKNKKTAKGSDWTSLTWDDLEEWAGSRSVSRGRSYQKSGQVQELAITKEGRLLADVLGSYRYVTTVVLNTGKKKANALDSECSCPVGYRCKHAVAVVAAYLQAVADGKKVPLVGKDDPRWDKLAAEQEDEDDYYNEDEYGDDEYGDNDFEDDDFQDDDVEEDGIAHRNPSKRKPVKPSPKTKRQKKTDWNAKIREHLQNKSLEELLDLLDSLVQRFPELREEFREQIALGEGDVDRLVAQARKEMQSLTSEIGWSNHWSGEGNIPDYSGFRHRLERLVSQGYYDAVVKLGREFLRATISQVEQSQDEGETAEEISNCLPIVFEAVRKSSLTDPQKILYAIDAYLMDDYDVVGDSVGKILDATWKPADWSAVADELEGRLKKLSKGKDDDFTRNYQRDHLSDWLTTALENSGRSDEVLSLYEAEAPVTRSYERLVKYLIEKKRFDDAERWAREGIEKTLAKLPGIASSLANSLCELARSRKQWNIVAGHAAATFFDRPGLNAFNELLSQAKKAGCADQVRIQALQFLETGKSPIQCDPKKKDQNAIKINSRWPLPVPDYIVPVFLKERPRYAAPGPHYDVLLDMAIADKQPDDVLKWYDKMQEGKKQAATGWGWQHSSYSDQVAEAVTKSHPQRALEIYQKRLNAFLPQTGIPAYEAAASYLKKMRPIMKSLGHDDEWVNAMTEIRLKYGNRPRFMEILDKLQGRTKTILEMQKSRKRH